METITPVNDDDVAGQTGARPPVRQYTAATAYHANASLSSFPPTSSSSFLPAHQHHPWQAEHTDFFNTIPELESNDVDDAGLFAMMRDLPMLPPPAAPATFAQPAAIHAPQQMQPAMQMQRSNHQPSAMAMQGGDRYVFPWQASAMAAPVHAAPLAAIPDAPLPAGPPKPASSRRRGRPRGSTAASKSKLASTAAAAAMSRQTAARRTAPEAMRGQERQTEWAPDATTSTIAARHDCEPEQCRDRREDEEPVDAVGEAEEEEAVVEYADTRPPGVRFRPSDVELIGYLKLKYLGRKMPVDFIKEFDVCKDHPKTVQEKCGNSVDGSWYVFSHRKRKYACGDRPARSVGLDGKVGYWKSNTKEADIIVGSDPIGKVNTLTFELGDQPNGESTPWKMKEYRIPGYQQKPDGSSFLLDPWVICKLFCKDEGEETTDDQSGKVVESMNKRGGGGDVDTIGENETADDQFGEVDESVNETGGGGNVDTIGESEWLNHSSEPADLSVEDYLVSGVASVDGENSFDQIA